MWLGVHVTCRTSDLGHKHPTEMQLPLESSCYSMMLRTCQTFDLFISSPGCRPMQQCWCQARQQNVPVHPHTQSHGVAWGWVPAILLITKFKTLRACDCTWSCSKPAVTVPRRASGLTSVVAVRAVQQRQLGCARSLLWERRCGRSAYTYMTQSEGLLA